MAGLLAPLASKLKRVHPVRDDPGIHALAARLVGAVAGLGASKHDELGEFLDPEESQAVVKELDKNGIGKVDPDEVPVKGKTKNPVPRSNHSSERPQGIRIFGVSFRPGKYRSYRHKFTGEAPEKPPGALKNPFLIRGYSFSGEKHLLQPFGGLFSGEKGRFFRQLDGKRPVQTGR